MYQNVKLKPCVEFARYFIQTHENPECFRLTLLEGKGLVLKHQTNFLTQINVILKLCL